MVQPGELRIDQFVEQILVVLESGFHFILYFFPPFLMFLELLLIYLSGSTVVESVEPIEP